VKLGPLHHVAVAVPSISESLPFYRDVLGLQPGRIRDIREQRVRVVFLGDDRQLLELVEPLDRESGVGRFVAERGRPTLHHVCYVVDDLKGTLARLEREGIELIDRAPRAGADGDVAFVHPRASGGVLIELIDRATVRESVP
jgi:methylmalonyl-CoA/ethylmalonyl-CoA epimerase